MPASACKQDNPIKPAVRTLRLLSGLVLLAFVASHLANLSIGLHSLAAMDAWRATLLGPWQMPAGRWLLGGAALVHMLLGLWTMAMRRSLAMSRTDWVQLALGLLTPPLLLAHVLLTAVAGEIVSGYEASYGFVLAKYWSISPAYALQHLVVVVFVWVHAGLGLYSWLVVKPVWRRIGGFVMPLLFAVPIVALLGFAEAGKEVVERLASTAEWREAILENAALFDAAREQLHAIRTRVLTIYGALVVAALLVLAARLLRDRMDRVKIGYDDGLQAEGRRGLSVLELSRINGIPHADVCSGRARCGTCRIRVEAGAGQLSTASETERATLARVGAGDGERLACQALVLGAGVSVTRLLPAYADTVAAREPDSWMGAAAGATGAATPGGDT